MLVGAAVCPHPPLLLREMNGQHDSVATLREACAAAVDALVARGPSIIAVVGGVDTRVSEPLSWRVASRLLATRWDGTTEWHPVDFTASRENCAGVGRELGHRDERLGLLVMADGSARRGEKAPGYFDPRAHAYDARVTDALEQGDWRGLQDLDVGLADQLMVQGRAALQVLAEATRHGTDRPVRAQIRYGADPFGVWYVVADWAT